jgi:hypothetical protein
MRKCCDYGPEGSEEIESVPKCSTKSVVRRLSRANSFPGFLKGGDVFSVYDGNSIGRADAAEAPLQCNPIRKKLRSYPPSMP